MKTSKRFVIWVVLAALVAMFFMPADLTYAKNPSKRKGVKIELTGGDGKIYKPGSTIPLWALENATYRLIKVDNNRGWLSVVFTNQRTNFSIRYQTGMGWGWAYGDLSVDSSKTKLMSKISKNSWLSQYKQNDPYHAMNLRELGEPIPLFTPSSDMSFAEYAEFLQENNSEYLTIGTQPTKKASKKWPKKKDPVENYIYECFYKIDLSATR